ncbi:Xylulose 5-phosphate/Fructose 6-phosphate phosphoketolase N-terminal [Penicillium verrucosum]|uniref:Xylulose 5-phosphate/Fructose 6-phosphate phosphoketolase N-terminal n=1 Tax=Penicillium verrucosum TaxID=60171 RepID=UPI00254529CA|nr:Xylulose 5-phosphate/Fructose 6-phosphate phosphoketolase N-terminal [Penicillium verrucosum]KAJ5931356.1 Xylulose 5-phosphate/Fructose 6-phosphate phosphoketolase N-terminal [Penicillium verrucosum]
MAVIQNNGQRPVAVDMDMAPLVSYHNLEGVYSEVHPDTGEDTEGVKKFFKQFTSYSLLSLVGLEAIRPRDT